MKKSVDQLYQEAQRFDEGKLYRSREYWAAAQNKNQAYERMRIYFGSILLPFLEVECRHFFEQGYLMGQADL